MKILTINKSQQKKLLSLCEKFFPEYKTEKWDTDKINIEFSKDADFELIHKSFWRIEEHANGVVHFIIKDTVFSEDDYKLEIPWYQLCLTELPKRIWKQIDWKSYHGSGWFEPDRKCYKFESFLYSKLRDSTANYDTFLTHTLLSRFPVDFLHNFVQGCKKNKYFKFNKTTKYVKRKN